MVVVLKIIEDIAGHNDFGSIKILGRLTITGKGTQHSKQHDKPII